MEASFNSKNFKIKKQVKNIVNTECYNQQNYSKKEDYINNFFQIKVNREVNNHTLRNAKENSPG